MDWNSIVSKHKNDPAFESFLLKYKDDPDFEWFKRNYPIFGTSKSIEISYTIENDVICNYKDSRLSIDNNDPEKNRSSIHDECLSDIVNDVNNRIVYTPAKNNLIFKESSKYSSEVKYLRDCTCNNCTGENNSLTENIPCMNIKLEYINFSPSSLSEINYQNLPRPVFKLIRFFIYIIFIYLVYLYN